MNKNVLMITGGVVFVIVIALLAWPKNKPVSSGDATVTGQTSMSSKPVQALYEEANALRKSGDMVKAKEIYKEISSQYTDFNKIEDVESQLADVNMKIIFSNTPVAESTVHEVKSGDTLGKLASQYGTTVDLIKASNNLQSDIIRLGQKLRIWQGHLNVFVDKSQNVLFLKNGDEVLKVYKVSTGINNSTPAGTFKIASKLIDPVWYNKGIVVPPDSPQNVLGSRWLGFDMPGYGIHGTIEPETIGQQVTAGCVRMRNPDVEEVYSLIPLGTEIVIVD